MPKQTNPTETIKQSLIKQLEFLSYQPSILIADDIESIVERFVRGSAVDCIFVRNTEMRVWAQDDTIVTSYQGDVVPLSLLA